MKEIKEERSTAELIHKNNMEKHRITRADRMRELEFKANLYGTRVAR